MNQHPEFPLDEKIIYLNHAAVAPWPRRTAEAVQRFAEENMHQGSLAYPHWMQVEQRLREQLRELINAPSANDIALVKNTSEALSIVAYGLPWQAGENIVTSNQEFPSNRIVWDSLKPFGVELREADLGSAESPEEALFALCDERTRLLSISTVQYGTGLRMDLERIGRYCREHGILFCADAIQSVGALQTDVQAHNIDFLAADGHKWMLGPEGLGVLYCRADLREKLRLNQYGWHMVEDAGNFDLKEWQPAFTARRFECGSPNMLTIHALSASLSVLLESGMEQVENAILDNSKWLFEQLEQVNGLELLTPTREGRFAGIVTFRIPTHDSPALHRRLMHHGLFCANRAGGIRFSPHFYTPNDKLKRAMELLLAQITS